jgi:uncharacterized protein with transglutaminase domain
MRRVDGNSSGSTDGLLLVLLGLPVAIALAKLPGLPTSAAFAGLFSLAGLPARFHDAVESVLFVPVGALVVVIFRLTLGIRVLGLFRPILLAIAFSIVGIPLSLAFLLFVLLVVVLLRPLLKTKHNYARIAVLLSVVAALLLLPLMVGTAWDLPKLRDIAFFPVIALCLTCESFAKAADRDGVREAAWRTIATALAGIIIAGLTKWSGILELFLRFPELLLAQAACILLINRHLAFHLFEGVNPLALCLSAAGAAPPEAALTVENHGLGD